MAIAGAEISLWGQTERDPNTVLHIATLQAGIDHSAHGNPGALDNFNVLADQARVVAASGPDLIVFPEYTTLGWPYPIESTINELAEPVPGNGTWYTKYKKLAQEIQTPIVAWLLEAHEGHLYNCAAFIDGQGNFIGKYRKVHANLGEQSNWGWSQGDSFEPIEFNGVKYGISICSDMWHPETIRCETLLGADVIIHMSFANDMRHLVPARGFDYFTPIVMSIYQGGCYAVDGTGTILGSIPENPAGYGLFEVHPFATFYDTKYGGRWDRKAGRLNVRKPKAYAPITSPIYRPDWVEVFLTNQDTPQTREQILARFKGHYDENDSTSYRTPLYAFQNTWNYPYYTDPSFPNHLVNAYGQHLYVLGKPALAYFGCEDPEAFVQRAKAEGVTVLRVALEGTPYETELGIDLWPWGGSRRSPDWTKFNETYWGEVERRIQIAGNAGLGIDLVIYHTLHPDGGYVSGQKAYWDQILLRLSHYANILTWEIADGYSKNPVFQDIAGKYFYDNDPYGRPVCTSGPTSDGAIWPEKNWMGLAINHSTTSSTEPHGLNDWYLAVARNTRSHDRPAWCNQSGDEFEDQNTDSVQRRKQAWLWNAAGCFWTHQSWDGCGGINDNTYQAPGAAFMKPLANFWQSIPFWTLSPNYSAVSLPSTQQVFSTLSNSDNTLLVTYICSETTGAQVNNLNLSLHLPEGSYLMTMIRPSDAVTLSTQSVATSGFQQSATLTIPSFTDDLVIVLQRE